MGPEVIIPSATTVTVVLALGTFLWRVFDKRFDRVDEQFKRVDEQFKRVDEQFKRVDDQFGEVDRRFGRFEAEVDAKLDKFAATVDARFGSLDAKVDALAQDHQSLARELSEFRGEMRGRLDAVFPHPTAR